MHGAPNYSPLQIIEAGQRAEADGQIQYAAQFYRHILDNFASSPEAALAYERLTFLETSAHAAPTYEPMVASAHWTQAQGTQAQGTQAPGTQAQGRDPRAAHNETGGALDHQLSMPAIARPRTAPAQNGAVQPTTGARARPIVSTRDGYRVGRLAAQIVTIAGSFAFVFGGVALVIVQAGMLPAGLPGFIAIILPFSGIAAAAGFGMIFFGQFARASFDTANATRELVAIARLKSGPPSSQHRH